MKRLLLVLIIILSIPSIVLADGIENYYINATILDNGDLEVEEYFNLTGSYNGMEKKLYYKASMLPFFKDASSYGGSEIHNGDALDIEEIRAVDVNSNFEFDNIFGDIFQKVDSASKGDYGVYTVSNINDNLKNGEGYSVLIYMPSRKNKAFYIKYIIKNMAILHNDVAELGWNVIGKDLLENIDNLEITLNIPNNKKEIRVWAHGPLSGESRIISSEQVYAHISNLQNKTAIDVRVVFDKEIIKNSNKKTNVNALNKILAYETDLAEKANAERQNHDKDLITLIEKGFKNFEQSISRSEYDLVLSNIERLYDIELKEKYNNELLEYQSKVDDYEYNVFQNSINNMEKKYQYNQAQESINKVFSDSLKVKMQNELQFAKQKMIKKELIADIKLALFSFSTLIIAWFIYYLYKKSLERKRIVEPKYLRQLPSDLSPSEVGLLVNKTFGKNEIAAELLELIRQKLVIVEKRENGSYDLVVKDYHKYYIKEQSFKRLLFDTASRINAKKIKKITFDRYKNTKDLVVQSLKQNGLIKSIPKDQANTLRKVGIAFLFTPFLPIGCMLIFVDACKKSWWKSLIWLLLPINIIIFLSNLVFYDYNHLSLIVSIIVFIFIKSIMKKIPDKIRLKLTSSGIKERNDWLAFKNFLVDFSSLDEKDLPEIVLWEEYLVYAVALGVGEKVLRNIKIKIESQELNLNEAEFGIIDNLRIANDIVSFSNHIKYATTKPYEIETYSGTSSGGRSSGGFSSGSGRGGGFSGGSSSGGSFGGGSGGGRF